MSECVCVCVCVCGCGCGCICVVSLPRVHCAVNSCTRFPSLSNSRTLKLSNSQTLELSNSRTLKLSNSLELSNSPSVNPCVPSIHGSLSLELSNSLELSLYSHYSHSSVAENQIGARQEVGAQFVCIAGVTCKRGQKSRSGTGVSH
jgi:hypothetical protein